MREILWLTVAASADVDDDNGQSLLLEEQTQGNNMYGRIDCFPPQRSKEQNK
jgi:hypothetical protein